MKLFELIGKCIYSPMFLYAFFKRQPVHAGSKRQAPKKKPAPLTVFDWEGHA